MFQRLLIANRGEIACRIIRTARSMGIRTIAVYSAADATARHVRLADEAYAIGDSEARHSYLNGERLLEVARRAGAGAVHPGYGFLSENADFAKACLEAGIIFVGPPPSAISAMGSKDAAKALMAKASVPVVPGYHGEDQTPEFLKAQAEEMGYPVLIKAVAGGGGKGMRRVDRGDDFLEALSSCQREARASFGNAHVLIERYVQAPRHIEVQIFADTFGNTIHLFERDCSLQRRHQKVIEEAPAPGMTLAMRARMGRAAVLAAQAVGYVGAGTVEFIVDTSQGLHPDGFFFMEMNTRLQVEHPVTEAILGVDLVEWQLRIAAGEPLPLTQDEVRLDGHALEARLYAEDPDRGFLPQTGTVHRLIWPEAPAASPARVRIDTGIEEGAVITPFYDPMLAKLIVHAPTRAQALAALCQAIDETVVLGIRSNLGFLGRLARDDAFQRAELDTGLIDRNVETLLVPSPSLSLWALALDIWVYARTASSLQERRWDPWESERGWTLSGAVREDFLHVTINGVCVSARLFWEKGGGRRYVLTVEDHVSTFYFQGGEERGAYFSVLCSQEEGFGEPRLVQAAWMAQGEGVWVANGLGHVLVMPEDLVTREDGEAHQGAEVKAPMPGKITQVFVKDGQRVEKDAPLLALEAMKMAHTLKAPFSATIASVFVKEGEQVQDDQILVVFCNEEDGDASGG